LALTATILFTGVAAANLLSNPGFTTWIDPGHPSGWTVEDTLVTRTRVEQDSITVLSAPYSAKLTRLVSGTGSNYGLKQYVPVSPGQVYTLAAWCFDDNVDGIGGISVTWCRADSSSLGNTGTIYTDSAVHTWQKLVRTDTVPDSTVYGKVLLRVYGWTGNQPDGYVFFDDADFDTGYGAVAESRACRPPDGSRLEVRPNPARGPAAVSFNTNHAADVDLALYDLAGTRRLELCSGRLGPGTQRFVLSGRDGRGASLPAGAYFLVLTEAGGRESSCKVLVQP
jgi:hypothetical protein